MMAAQLVAPDEAQRVVVVARRQVFELGAQRCRHGGA